MSVCDVMSSSLCLVSRLGKPTAIAKSFETNGEVGSKERCLVALNKRNHLFTHLTG